MITTLFSIFILIINSLYFLYLSFPFITIIKNILFLKCQSCKNHHHKNNYSYRHNFIQENTIYRANLDLYLDSNCSKCYCKLCIFEKKIYNIYNEKIYIINYVLLFIIVLFEVISYIVLIFIFQYNILMLICSIIFIMFILLNIIVMRIQYIKFLRLKEHLDEQENILCNFFLYICRFY